MLRTAIQTLARAVGAIFLVGTITVAQTVVSGGGDALNLAIELAVPGDHLIVRPGRYLPLLVDRGLRIEMDAGVIIESGQSHYACRIAGIPAGQELFMRGGRVTEASALFTLLSIEACRGTVTWTAPTFGSAQLAGSITIEDCALVSIESPTFPPAHRWQGNNWHIRIERSAVCLSDCSSSGAVIATVSSVVLEDFHVVSTYNANSLNATDSIVTVSGGSLPGSTENIGWFARSGLRLSNAHATLTGGTTISAGAGSSGLKGAIDGFNRSTVRIDPSVRLNGGIRGDVTVTAETVTDLDLPATVRSGQLLDMHLTGDAGDFVLVFWDWPRTPSATPFGALWVDSRSPIFDSAFIPSSGVWTTSYRMPPLPEAVRVALQPIRLTTTGRFGLGPAVRMTIN